MPNSTFKLYKLILLCMFFFSVVGCKFNNYEYNSITEVIGDIRLILENCYRYNGSDHWVSKLGHKMEKILEQKLALLNRCKFQTIQYLRLQKSHVFQCWCNWRLEETFRVTVISINIFFYMKKVNCHCHGEKGSCKATTRSGTLHLSGLGECIFIREISLNFICYSHGWPLDTSQYTGTPLCIEH